MEIKESDISGVLKKIDKEELADLALELGKIPSPWGQEAVVGDFVFKWMKENGFSPFKQEVLEDRFNVIGILKGKGTGQSLMFNGHLDTAFGLPEDTWILGELKPEHYLAHREGDVLFGHGVINDKGPVAAFLIAAKAIKESGIQLGGDLLLTAVVGEIGAASIDEFQGTRYMGKGIGSRHLVSCGVIADHVLVAEATNFCPTWVEAGDLWLKITVRGRGGIYTPYISRPVPIEENPNAIVKAAKIILALEEWAIDFERKNKYEFAGGTLIPKVNIGSIRGGLPYRASNTVGVCNIYVDVRIPPGRDPSAVKLELGNLIKKTGIDAEIETYLYRRGYEGENVSTLTEAIRKAHHSIFHDDPKKISSPQTSMWRDINIFNGIGIPAVTYGQSSVAGGGIYSLKIEDLYKAAQVYALTALNICKV